MQKANPATVLPQITALLADALNLDETEITPESTLQGDLGAESIDILDITFRLEREFGVTIPRQELFPTNVFDGNGTHIHEGVVTTEGIKKLKEALPHSDFTNFEQNPIYDNIVSLFTVNTLTRYIQHKLTTKPTLAPLPT